MDNWFSTASGISKGRMFPLLQWFRAINNSILITPINTNRWKIITLHTHIFEAYFYDVAYIMWCTRTMFDFVVNRQSRFSKIKIYQNLQFLWHLLLEFGWTDSTLIATNTKVASGEKFPTEKKQQNVWGYHMTGPSATITLRSNRDQAKYPAFAPGSGTFQVQ